MKRVFFFRPTLDEGGADRVTLTRLHHLDRSRFEPTPVLMRPREVIAESGRDGLPVPVRDAAALADRAVALLRAHDLRERVSQAARRSAQRFTVSASVARYQEAIGG